MIEPETLHEIAKFNLAPLPAPRMVRSDKWSKRSVVLKYFSFRSLMRYEARKQNFVLPPDLIVKFFIAMPPAWSKTKRAYMNGKPHQQTPDIDNLCKSFMDSLCSQDSYVHSITASKVWSVEPQIIIYSHAK
ncbi:MAG: RusA family crossover junction endodeoxyribonuclease [Bacteroidota bacterium]